MKKVDMLKPIGVIIILGFGTLAALISTVYFVTNARLLFSGDYSIYAFPVLGFFDTFFSVITYSAIIGFVVVSYLFLLKKNFVPRNIYFILAIGFFVLSLAYVAMNKLWLSNGLEGILVFVNKMSLLATNIGILLILIFE